MAPSGRAAEVEVRAVPVSEATGAEDKSAGAWGIGGWALVAAAFVVGFVNFPMQVVGWTFECLPGDGIDNRLNNFVLEHGYRYLCGRADSFWDAPAFYPAPRITASSDAHIGTLPFYAALRVFGLSPEAAFQGYFLISFVLNFAAAAWGLRRLGAGAAGVAAGAYVFAFGLPLAGQLIHAQLFHRFMVPLVVVFGWEFLRTPRLSLLAACLGCLVYQIYVSIYIGYFLVLLMAVGSAVTVARFGSRLPWGEIIWPCRRVLFLNLALLVIAMIALMPLGKAHSGLTHAAFFKRELVPLPASWLNAPPEAAMPAPVTEPESIISQEHHLFVGYMGILAIGAGLIASTQANWSSKYESSRAVAAWSVLILAVFVTQFDFVWLYRPILELPGGGTVRSIGRVVLVLLFPIAVLIAAGVDRVVSWAGRFGQCAVVLSSVVAVALVAADLWLTSASNWKESRYSRELAVSRQEHIKAEIMRNPAPTLLFAYTSYRQGEPGGNVEQIEAMRAAQDLGIPCVNGYTGYLPANWSFFTNEQELMNWLKTSRTPPEKLAGLVIVDKRTR